VCAALIACGVLAACGGGGGGDATIGPDGDVAIQVGAQKITNGDIERRAMFLATAPQPIPQGETAQPGPPAKDSKAFREFRLQAAEQLRDEKVFGMLAARCGKPCAVTEADIELQLAQLQQSEFNGDAKALDQALTERGITRDDLKASLKASQQEQKLTARAEAKVRFTDAEALAYYRKNIDQYKLAAEKRLSHILLPNRAQALAVRAQATPENFARLARERSIDEAAKASGGDLGPVNGSGLLPELAEAVPKLKPGQVSQPVQTQFGWHLLLVRDIKARTKTFEEVKEEIIAQEAQVKRAAAVQKWRDTVLKREQGKAKFLNEKIAPEKPAPTSTTTGTTTTSTGATTGGTTVTAPATIATATGPATP
jgi:parvulin-like peptidyl-prolyl isomerase